MKYLKPEIKKISYHADLSKKKKKQLNFKTITKELIRQ